MTTVAYLPRKNGRGNVNSVEHVLSRCVADLVTDCVLWTGATSKGYGYTKVNNVSTRVHRYVYEQLVGPIPTGLTLDHLCAVRCCVNPDHLEPVTASENLRRRWETWRHVQSV